MNPESQSGSPNPVPNSPDSVEGVAARWVERRDRGLEPAEREEFRAWLKADPRHTAAFARADTKADVLDWPWHTGTMDQVAAGLEARARRRRRRRMLAATAGLAASVAVAFLLVARRTPSADPAHENHAVVSLPTRRVLPDGSVVELKDGARIVVDFSDSLRRVVLPSGSAFFQVAKNPLRPFVVQAPGVEVRAVGTAFAVQLGPSAVEVTVTEGRVSVDRTETASGAPRGSAESPAQRSHSMVDAGNTLVISVPPGAARDAVVQPVPESVLSERLAWRVPRLQFSDTPLAEVVAMMNDHNRVRLVIADPSLGQLRLSGVLRADKVDALVRLLESDFPVKAEALGDSEIVLRKAP